MFVLVHTYITYTHIHTYTLTYIYLHIPSHTHNLFAEDRSALRVNVGVYVTSQVK